jgi:hypothetical protein
MVIQPMDVKVGVLLLTLVHVRLVILLLPVDAQPSLVTPTSLTPMVTLLMAARPAVARLPMEHARLVILLLPVDAPLSLVPPIVLIPTTMQQMGARLAPTCALLSLAMLPAQKKASAPVLPQ